MQESLPPTEPAVPADGLRAERPVRHMAQAQVNDLVDPWWMNEVLASDYREFVYKQWPLELDDVPPEVIDGRLPEGVDLVRRGTLLNTGRVQCVLKSDGALAAVQLVRQLLWVGVAGRDLEHANRLLTAIEEAFPKTERSTDDVVGSAQVRLAIWGQGDDTRGFRRLDVVPWQDITDNYAPSTRKGLEPLMALDYEPGGGHLLVWYGAPGTGKSFALGSLAYAWREWAAFTYIADPDSLLSETSYLLEFMTLRDPNDRWRVAILEDTGELFGADASRRTGQGLSRLLNATDGMLGQGSKTLFVITTNEPIGRFHQAVIRPGRCASRVEFEALPADQAKAWLLERGAADVAKHVHGSTTVAELYAMFDGGIQKPEEHGVGVYL